MVDRKRALSDLQDWLNEINFVVSNYSFHPEDWYERVIAILAEKPVLTPGQRFQVKHTVMHEGIVTWCRPELDQLDAIVEEINQFPEPERLQKIVRQAYVIVYPNTPIDRVLDVDF